MTGDDRQQETWSEAVRPFRRAVNALSDALPEWLGGILSADELLSELTIELPLVGFAPFAALPEELPQRAHTPSPEMARPAARAPDLAGEYPVPRRGAQPAAPGTAGRRGEQQPLARKAERGAGAQIPVFSLRGRQPASRSDAQKGPPGEPGSGQQHEAALAKGNRPARPGEANPSLSVSPKEQATLGEGLPGETEPWRPTSLLGQLADDVLRQTGRARGAPAAGAAQGHSQPRALYERSSPLVEKPSPGRDENGEPEAGLGTMRALSVAGAGAQDASGTPPSFAGDVGRLVQSAAAERLPGVDSAATLARINSLADHLLRSRYRLAGIGLQPHQNEFEVQDTERPLQDQERSAAFETGDLAGEQDEVAAPPLDVPEGQGPVPAEQVDAETLAALINDILVEQARWHGVDLA